jgi:hypothetical protein
MKYASVWVMKYITNSNIYIPEGINDESTFSRRFWNGGDLHNPLPNETP